MVLPQLTLSWNISSENFQDDNNQTSQSSVGGFTTPFFVRFLAVSTCNYYHIDMDNWIWIWMRIWMDVKNDEMFDIIDLITFGEEPVVFDEEFGTLTASLIGNCLNYISDGY